MTHRPGSEPSDWDTARVDAIVERFEQALDRANRRQRKWLTLTLFVVDVVLIIAFKA